MNFVAQAMNLEMVGQPLERSISRTSQRLFLIWTLFWWGGVGVCAILFYAEVLGFLASTKIALYSRVNRNRMDIIHPAARNQRRERSGSGVDVRQLRAFFASS